MTKMCLCNNCVHGPAEKIPPKISIDFESWCGIALREADGRFAPGYNQPLFGEEGKVCPLITNFAAYCAEKREAQKAA